MNEFDQFMKHGLKVERYIRYMDDFVIVHHDKAYLLETLDNLKRFLREQLNLELHPYKVGIRKLRQGIDFLGYVQLSHARVLRTKTRQRIFRKMKLKVRQFKSGLISEESLFATFNSYMSVLKHANSHRLQEGLKHMLWHLLASPDK